MRAKRYGQPGDVDLSIEAERGFSLFDAAKIKRLVSEDLGVDVDVVSERSLSGSFVRVRAAR